MYIYIYIYIYIHTISCAATPASRPVRPYLRLVRLAGHKLAFENGNNNYTNSSN